MRIGNVLLSVLVLLILFSSFVMADEFNSCPGIERTIQGTVHLAEGERWTRGDTVAGVEFEIESACGNVYNNIVSDSDGTFSVKVTGPVHIKLVEGSPYFGAAHYIHNKNTNGHMRVKEGKEVKVNIVGSQYRGHKVGRIILDCTDGVHSARHPTIQLTKNMGDCTLVIHDNKRYTVERIDFDSVGTEMEVRLTSNVEDAVFPSLTPLDDESVFKVHKGWNLLPTVLLGNSKTSCFDNHEDSYRINFYEYMTKQYINNPESYYESWCSENKNTCDDMREKLVSHLIHSSVWYYSPVECEMVKRMETREARGIPFLLSQSWNFRFVNEDMVGKSLQDMKGTCDVLSTYAFDGDKQSWAKMGLTDSFTRHGSGFVIKVAQDCEMNTLGSVSAPPSLPE